MLNHKGIYKSIYIFILLLCFEILVVSVHMLISIRISTEKSTGRVWDRLGRVSTTWPIGQKMAKSKSTILGQLFSKKNSRMDHTPPLVCPYHTITMSTGVTMDDRFFEAYPVVVVREWGIEDKYSPLCKDTWDALQVTDKMLWARGIGFSSCSLLR